MSGRPTLESRLARLVCIAAAIPGAALLLCLWLLDSSPYVFATVAFLLLCLTGYAAAQVRVSVDYQFRSVQNLLEAVKSGDYSLRLATSQRSGALREVMSSMNDLVASLQAQKQRAEERQLLLDKVLDQIDVAILAWDDEERISFMNRSARHLLLPVLPSPCAEGVAQLPAALRELRDLSLRSVEVRELALGGMAGRFRLYKDRYFSGGDTLSLLFITDVDTLLRKEEKRAWQKLIRVISHEINNSLAPLASLSEAMRKQVRRREQDPQLAEELEEGLRIVQGRSEALTAFLARYRVVASLGDPAYGIVALPGGVEGLPRLFPQVRIALSGAPLRFAADAAQFQQLMINLLKNAVEAQAPDRPDEDITISWEEQDGNACICIADRGQGVQNPGNLFTPFYSTKKQGQGIGLVLAKEIVLAHGGSISLANREDGPGCIARLTFPLAPSSPA